MSKEPFAYPGVGTGRMFPPTAVDGQPPIEIGPNHYLYRIMWEGVWVGVKTHHLRPDTGDPCASYSLFAVPEADTWAAHFVAGASTRWQVTSLEPLTMAPSLQCGACPMHGFVVDGRWVGP